MESYDSSTESIGDKRDAKKRRVNSPDKSETTHEAAGAGDNSYTKAAAQDGQNKFTVIGSGRTSGAYKQPQSTRAAAQDGQSKITLIGSGRTSGSISFSIVYIAT